MWWPKGYVFLFFLCFFCLFAFCRGGGGVDLSLSLSPYILSQLYGAILDVNNCDT